MTLGVAALFPWPQLVAAVPLHLRLALEQSPHLNPTPAILFAADSQWTWTKTGEYDHGAVKLAAIGPHAVAIYAGDTVVGPRTIGLITEESRRLSVTEPTRFRRLIRDASQSVWRRHKLPESRVELCIGIYHQSSGLVLWRISNEDGFKPHERSGVQTIGSDRGRMVFWDALKAETDRRASKPMTEEAFDYSAEGWGLALGQAVAIACQGRKDPTVGGPILQTVLSATGARGRALYEIDKATGVSTRHTLTDSDAESFNARNLPVTTLHA